MSDEFRNKLINKYQINNIQVYYLSFQVVDGRVTTYIGHRDGMIFIAPKLL